MYDTRTYRNVSPTLYMPTLLTPLYPYSVDLNRLDEILLYTTSNKIRKGKLNRGFLRSKLRDVLASSRTNQRTNERTSELSRAKERARFFVSLLLFFLFFSFLFARGSSFWRRWKILEPGDKTIDPEYLELLSYLFLFLFSPFRHGKTNRFYDTQTTLTIFLTIILDRPRNNNLRDFADERRGK